MDVEFGASGPCFMRVDDVSLSFLNLMDGAYPYDARVKGLFDALASCVRSRGVAWRALLPARR